MLRKALETALIQLQRNQETIEFNSWNDIVRSQWKVQDRNFRIVYKNSYILISHANPNFSISSTYLAVRLIH